MSFIVTGATGHLGRHTVESLLSRGVSAEQIVATGRDLGRIDDLAARGVQVRAADYTDPESLRDAFKGGERLLLVSASDVGQRLPQHRNAIEAAQEVGVDLILYTSVAGADRTSMSLAVDHRGTELALAESGVSHVLLRNGWYLENYTGQLATYLEHGVVGSAGDGKVSAAPRADYAEAAAAVLLADDPAGKVYELGGDSAFTLADLAREVAEASGREVAYTDLPAEQYAQVLAQAGLPQAYAEILADCDLGVARGELFVDTGDLSRLLGRPTMSLRDAVREALDGGTLVG